ncbi:glutathione S-transferase family protein [Acidisoma sp. L85]|uniref:glutathione S-transferase family protein n=1 Tax=Acidisoma sp. L85 TaxID=1641850 RepID=UPI0020B10FF1|nr:glutathione S-transferase family protein [Acidisoma sp. L85]
MLQTMPPAKRLCIDFSKTGGTAFGPDKDVPIRAHGRRGIGTIPTVRGETKVKGTEKLTLYELAAADRAVRFSPHCWKIRMALAHKGLEAETIPWLFTEKELIAFSGSRTVPVLIHDQSALGDRVAGNQTVSGEVVSDSWRIALYLEERFPARISLFGGVNSIPLAEFINTWADTALLPSLAQIILMDIHTHIHERDRDYFRSSREKAFGKSLEDVVADKPAHLAALKQVLTPVRRTLRNREFISGAAPAYADYCVFGMFMWVRCISAIEPLESDDPIFAWRDRMLDAFGGLARNAAVADRGRR